jgi:hypothetical protein
MTTFIPERDFFSKMMTKLNLSTQNLLAKIKEYKCLRFTLIFLSVYGWFGVTKIIELKCLPNGPGCKYDLTTSMVREELLNNYTPLIYHPS